MPSLTDLLNPTFFLLLAILLLCSALTFVYFESKMREQNHKINSMLSLISTLAEDMNGVKIGLNHLAMSKFNHMNEGEGQQPLEQFTHTVDLNRGSQLIEVSDDGSDDSDDGSDDSDDEDEDDESDNEDYDHPEIKVLKIDTLSAVFDIDDHIKTDLNDQIVELNDDQIVVDKTISADTSILEEDATVADEHSLEIKYMNVVDKTVSTEGQTKNYKKMSLAELKTTALNQGIILEDGAKLKKQEILDLLFQSK